MKKFIQSRKINATAFMIEKVMTSKLGGKWINGKECSHILKIDLDEFQFDVICKYNLLHGVKPDMFTSPHRFAHHLTSSQVMCYNYFRPLIDSEGVPSEAFRELLESKKVDLPDESICEFEVENPLDHTSYDMAAGPVRFEIKFTECGFGTAKSDDKHMQKFDKVYLPMINACECLSCKPDQDMFFKHYQLFRNVLHIDDKSRFAIFIFPKANKQCQREFLEFYKFINDEYKDNVQVWYWEDLLEGKEDTDFYKKYLR